MLELVLHHDAVQALSTASTCNTPPQMGLQANDSARWSASDRQS